MPDSGAGTIPATRSDGAAVSTTIGRSTGVALQLWYLFSGNSRILVRARHMVLDVDVMKRLSRIAFNGMVQYMVSTASWLALVRLVAQFGADALAGYTIAIRIIIFAILPSWGMSNAAATLVGQNLGAKSPERAEQAVWRTGLYNMTFLGQWRWCSSLSRDQSSACSAAKQLFRISPCHACVTSVTATLSTRGEW